MTEHADTGARTLQARERRLFAVLGLPSLAFALAATVVTTYLPVVAHGVTGSAAVIGMLIALEGAFALWLPLVVGARSDRLRTRFGRRLPFVMAGTPLVAVALAGLAVSRSLVLIALAVALFFFGYFLAYEPYRALYPDLVEADAAGRGQSTQALWRGGGTGLALVGGGWLLTLGDAVPFVVAAVVVALAVGLFLRLAVRRVRSRPAAPQPDGDRPSIAASLRLAGSRPGLRSFLAANALWELSLSALKTFAFLYVTVGLGRSRSTASLAIGAVALVVLVAAPLSGRLADRIGPRRVLSRALPVYGSGLLLVPVLAHHTLAMILVLPAVAFGGAVIMTLPYALLIPLMPEGRNGEMTGLYSVSRGVGAALGPLIAGGAISLLAGPLEGTQGYAAMWLVCGAAILLSLPLLRRVRA